MKSISLIILLVSIFSNLNAEESLPNKITVYKNPECTCCTKWVAYLRKNNYQVNEVVTRNVYAHKERLGVPPQISSCHTAEIGGYVVEGHVTHRDITRMLLFRPDIIGIAVPGMPVGTPGMEQGDFRDPYEVKSFDKAGNIEVFVKHE